MKAVQSLGIISFASLALAFVPSTAFAQTAPPAAPAPISADSLESVHQQLITLQKMLDEHLVTPQEYDAARTKLLVSIGALPAPVPAPAPAPAPAPVPAPQAPPVAAAPPAPPPPSPAALLAGFAGRWDVARTRIDTLPSQTIASPEPPSVWVVTAPNGALAISREEEVSHFGHRAELVLTPQLVTTPTITGSTLTFSIQQTVTHEHVSTSTTTYQLQLTSAAVLTGTYTRDTTNTEPHGVVTTHEAGKVELTRLPG